MKCFQLEIKGRWAHFKRPETNNNPLSHDIITKTALIGMIGAVMGIERKKMKGLFPVLSEDLLYNVQTLDIIRKVSIGLTSWKVPSNETTRKSFEMLKEPDFLVTLALTNIRSSDIYESFKECVINQKAVYTPVLGWHNCPAELKYISEGDLSDNVQKGDYCTKGFVVTDDFTPQVDMNFRVGFDKLPTFQNNDFWNLPNKYVQVIYPEYPHQLRGAGRYNVYKSKLHEECLCMI